MENMKIHTFHQKFFLGLAILVAFAIGLSLVGRGRAADICQMEFYPATLPPVQAGVPYTQQISVLRPNRGDTNMAISYSYELDTPPAGLDLYPSPDGNEYFIAGNTFLMGTPEVGSTTFTITATDSNECSGQHTYTLDATEAPPILDALQVGPDSIHMVADTTEQLTAMPLPFTASITEPVIWTSSDPSVATVETILVNDVPSNSGSVFGIMPGTVTITATSGNFSASAEVTVVPHWTGIDVTPDTSTIYTTEPDHTGVLTASPLASNDGDEQMSLIINDTTQPERSIYSQNVQNTPGLLFRFTLLGAVSGNIPTNNLFGPNDSLSYMGGFSGPELLFTDNAQILLTKLNYLLKPSLKGRIWWDIDAVDRDNPVELNMYHLKLHGLVGTVDHGYNIVVPIKWSSSDDAIATVVPTGSNTAQSTGISVGTIDATAASGGLTLQELVFNDFEQRFSTSRPFNLGYGDTASVNVRDRFNATLNVSVEEVNASVKPNVQGDTALETKIFAMTSGKVCGIDTQPKNWAQIYTTCDAYNTKNETFSQTDDLKKGPRNLIGDLQGIGANAGDNLVVVRSQQNSDGSYSYVGFKVPGLKAGESRDVGFTRNPGQTAQDHFVQNTYFTKNSKGIWTGSRVAQTINGSFLQVIAPEFIDWANGAEIYPFTFISDSAFDVDVCLSVPSGYKIVAPATCSQTLVDNEAKVLEFTLQDVGSPKDFDVGAKMKIKHKGKNYNVDLKVPSQNKKAKGN